MKNKKILHVISVSFVINHFFGNQFVFFKKKGYKFYVACTPDEKLYAEAKEKNFEPFGIPILRSINPVKDVISIYKLYVFIKKEKIEVVIGHSPKGGLIGMIAAKLAGVEERVFFRHGLVFETAKGLKKIILVFIEKIIGFLAVKVVNVSESIIVESNKYNLNNPRKNILLGRGTCSGIDIKKFKPNEKTTKKFVVGYVGRLSKDKGIEELVGAWKLFKKVFNDVEMHLVGPFDERDPVSEEINAYIKVEETIKHYGLVESTAIYYNNMDVFILPSYREGFGMVILEASASGIPVITTKKTGCINAIVENKTGIFTEINENSIFENLKFYYHNPDVRKTHGLNGVCFVNEYFKEEYIFNEIENKVFN